MPNPSPQLVDPRHIAIETLQTAALAAEAGCFSGSTAPVDGADFLALTPEDLREQLDRIVMGPHPDIGMDALLMSGALEALLPELNALVGFGDCEWRHKDVWKHTKQVVTQADLRIEVRYAALFHDIGKVKTRSVSPDGEVHFFGHAEVGARMFDRLDKRLKLFESDTVLHDNVRSLILNHLRASHYDGQWTDSAVRRFAREIGAQLDNLLCLSRADITTKRAEKRKRGLELIDELAHRITQLAAADAVTPLLPKGVGNAVMDAFGLPPGRIIGDIKRALEAAVDSGKLDAHREPGYYVQHISTNRARFGIP
jgi:poly(A) polymerase